MDHLLNNSPQINDPSFIIWDPISSKIMAWMWITMTPNIRRTCLYLSRTTKHMDSLHQTYFKARNAAQLYELKLKMMNLRHG